MRSDRFVPTVLIPAVLLLAPVTLAQADADVRGEWILLIEDEAFDANHAGPL